MPRPSLQFTLIETMIVLLIGAMIAVIVVPVIGRIPNRVAIRQTTTELDAVFSTAARRARATGATVTLELQLEERLAQISDAAGPTATQSTEEAETAPDDKLAQKLSREVEWQWDGLENPIFTFLPSGQAEGPLVSFTLRKKTFYLELDNLTGTLDVVENND